MTTTQLGPRPSDPSTISFAAHCFEQLDDDVYYVVIPSRRGIPLAGSIGGRKPQHPERFESSEAAEAYLDSKGLESRYFVAERREQRRRRVSWA